MTTIKNIKLFTSNFFPVWYNKIFPNQAGKLNHLSKMARLSSPVGYIFTAKKVSNGHLHDSIVGFLFIQLTSTFHPDIYGHLPTTNGNRRIDRFGITFILSLKSLCCLLLSFGQISHQLLFPSLSLLLFLSHVIMIFTV